MDWLYPEALDRHGCTGRLGGTRKGINFFRSQAQWIEGKGGVYGRPDLGNLYTISGGMAFDT